MKSGELRTRAEIESATTAADSATGEMVKTWSRLVYRWCKIEPLGGMESAQNKQYIAEATHKVTLRYYSAVTPAMRLKIGSVYYSITSVMHAQEKDVTTLAVTQNK